MAHLIDKDALVAWALEELKLAEKFYKETKSDVYFGKINLLKKQLYFLDTLEVKEEDLEKELNDFLDNVEGVPRMWHSDEQIEWAKDIAKHFFELGLKASNPLTWEDIRDILDLYDEVTSMDYCSDIYEEVLKRFKAQKGEKV